MEGAAPGNTASHLDDEPNHDSPCCARTPGNARLAYTFEPIPGAGPLGEGAFGRVDICHRTDDHSIVVAIKRMRYSKDEDRNAQLDRALANEIAVLRLCRHPNILEYWGLSRGGAPDGRFSVGIVTSYMENGTMESYLREHPSADRHKLLREVAAGLEYLHTPRVDPGSGQTITIVHGDIHNGNVLVAASGTAVLADFGLSEIIVRDGATASESSESLLRPDGIALGNASYIAPELHDHRKIQADWPAAIVPEVAQHAGAGRRTAEADIFAFGMLVFGAFGGALGARTGSMATVVALIEGKRPAREDVVHPAFRETDWQLVCACWHGDAARRPSIGDIRARL